MRVDPAHLHRRRRLSSLDGGVGRSRRHGEAELGIVLARLDELVGVGFDARGHPDEDPGRLRSLRYQVFDPVQIGRIPFAAPVCPHIQGVLLGLINSNTNRLSLFEQAL